MKLVFFALVALTTIGLIASLVVGAPREIVGVLFLALAVMVLATFFLGRLKSIFNLELDRRLPRALLTNDRR